MALKILGIRHHGVGSAKNVRQALPEIKPDIILVEGPEPANHLINIAGQEGMVPPVALLLYELNNHKNCVYYPFAEFSPEWQALKYGLKHNIPVRFIDLVPETKIQEKTNPETPDVNQEDYELEDSPFEGFAKNLGYPDSEKLWQDIIENRNPDINTFEAILQFFEEVRSGYKNLGNDCLIREAYMREKITMAEKEGFKEIAVVCGAFHSPALLQGYSEADRQLLENYTKKDYEALWVPWSYTRLCFYSGYGAGIDSPGWSHHIWNNETNQSTGFISKIAFLLRARKIDISSDGVIEAVKLAGMLAGLRGRENPILNDILDGVLAAMCNGNRKFLELVSKELITGSLFGKIPATAPVTLIQKDFYQQLESCNLKTDFEKKFMKLDLTTEYGKKCSRLFYRLNLLEIPFAIPRFKGGFGQVFREGWQLEWQEGFEILVIEKGAWGNTIEEAAYGFTRDKLKSRGNILELCQCLGKTIGADLPEIHEELISRIEEEAIETTQAEKLIAVFPPLVQSYRYVNIRNTEHQILARIIKGILNKIFISIPGLCINLDDDSFSAFASQVAETDYYISVFNDGEYQKEWYVILEQILDNPNVHSLVSGFCCKILFEKHFITLEKTVSYLDFNILRNPDFFMASFWIQGFLKNSTQLFIHNPDLLKMINTWLGSMSGDNFRNCLPVLKKSFSGLSRSERNKIAKMVVTGYKPDEKKVETVMDTERAEKILPVLKNICHHLGMRISNF